jgi:DNA-directed RNA polymerase specialized sigma24 family protein
MTDAWRRLFSEWELVIARSAVRAHLCRCPCLRRYDFEFLLSGCLAHWYARHGTYRRGRGASRRTYMSRVLSHHLADLARRELAEKRRADLLAVSLDAPLDPDDPGLTLLDTLDSAGLPGAHSSDPGLLLDLLCALERLTPLQRELCLLLAGSVPKSDIASFLGRSRDTVYEEIRRIRAIFRNDALQEYL